MHRQGVCSCAEVGEDRGPEVAGPEDMAGEERPEDAAIDEEAMSRKDVKKVFDLMRSYFQNTAAFANSLFEDRRLQKQIRIIIDSLEFLHQEFASDCKVHAAGQRACAHWQGQRSQGAWYKTVCRMFEFLQSPQMIKRLDLQLKPFSRHQAPLLPDDAAVKEDCFLVTRLFNFNVDLAANRRWSQSFHMYLLPYSLACVLAEGQDVETRLRNMAGSLLKLEEVVNNLPAGKHHILRDLYKDLGTSDWQITREILVVGRQANWSAQDPDLRSLAECLFAGSASTKESLESAFAWLKDCLRASKSSRVSVWTRWCYLFLNPYVREGGMPQVIPTELN